MKLEELVPPLELCKLIPEGEFEDSALMWVLLSNGREYKLKRRTTFLESQQKYISAPTLEEILQELVNLSVYRIKVCKSWGEWHIDCYDNERLIEKDSVKNIATAALKLWLKMKGIDYEK